VPYAFCSINHAHSCASLGGFFVKGNIEELFYDITKTMTKDSAMAYPN